MRLPLPTLSLRLRRRPRLLVVCLHQLLPEWQEPGLLPFLPFQPFTVQQLEEMILWFKERGYTWVAPHQLGSLQPGQDYALLTLDDGYANNLLALPVLEQHQVPATFFICTDNCLNQKAYWWDIIWRVTTDMGWHPRYIYKHIEHLKKERLANMEEALAEQYPPETLAPEGELDRPMTREELATLAAHPLATLGLHSHSHQLLTVEPALTTELLTTNRDLLAQLGQTPTVLAYPNGTHSPQVLADAAPLVQWAFTTRPGINPLSTLQAQRLLLRRIMPTGSRPLHRQLLRYHRMR